LVRKPREKCILIIIVKNQGTTISFEGHVISPSGVVDITLNLGLKKNDWENV